MPELPEVQTTVDGVNRYAKGLRIVDIWTDYKSIHHAEKDNIKDPKFFASFKRSVVGAKIKNASRRAKNVLIHLSNGGTIIIHMKMTGHLLYGAYTKKGEEWIAKEGPLRDDPFNRHIRLVFNLSNGRSLALSDLRRFAKVTLVDTEKLHESDHIKRHGPEPLDPRFALSDLEGRLALRPNGKIKQVLMDHEIIAGIGNIYSDEILWKTGIHPLERVKDIPRRRFSDIFRAMRTILKKGVDFGGDSMSDYRNILGVAGEFQGKHEAYRRAKERCRKPGCGGMIERIKVGGRSAHFCPKHQKLGAKR